jgi:predicted nucleic acid-binding protein
MTGEALYVDTSALMRALLEGDEELLALLRAAPVRVTSALTLVEAPRVLWRALLHQRIDARQQQDLLQALREFEAHCRIIPLEHPVLERARERFPVEFVGTLDALHLASALLYAHRLGPLRIASTDERLRQNARSLGMRVCPAQG